MSSSSSSSSSPAGPPAIVYPPDYRPASDYEMDKLIERCQLVQKPALDNARELDRLGRELKSRGMPEVFESGRDMLALSRLLADDIRSYISMIHVLSRMVERTRPPRRDGSGPPIRYRGPPSPPPPAHVNGNMRHQHPPPRPNWNKRKADDDSAASGCKRISPLETQVTDEDDLGF